MRTIDKYKFLLIAASLDGGQQTSYIVHPAFSKFSVKDTKDTRSWVFVRSSDCEMTLCGDEADIIINGSLFIRYTMVVTDNNNVEVVRLHFKKTDCDIDVNHRSVKVQPYVEDGTKKLLDGVDNEYNLVDIIPSEYKKDINFLSRPSEQVYAYTVGGGDTDMHIFTVGGHRSVQIAKASSGQSLLDCHFGYKVSFTAYGLGIKEPLTAGRYASVSSNWISTDKFISTSYSIAATNSNGYILFISDAHQEAPDYEYQYRFILNDSNYNFLGYTRYYTWDELFNLTEIVFNLGSLYGERFAIRVYATFSRIMNNKMGDGIITEDIYPASYTKSVVAPAVSYTSKNTSLTDTGYGTVEGTNEYYDTPDHNHDWIPFYQESWHKGLSIWLRTDYLTQSEIDYYSADETIPDFYALTDVIRHILHEIDSSIVFTDDAQHSIFLTEPTNPVTGMSQGRLYITQKSNLLNYHYDYPAWKAPCKLSQIFTMLENALNCRYDIYTDSEGVKHLRIEHVVFYLNGYSYDTNTLPLVNLKSVQDGRNGKPFSFLTNKWKYKTDSQPIRYEFAWMDTQSEAFAGYPIEVPDQYRIFTSETTESRTIDWFSTDFDFLMSVPSECNSDGFVLAETETVASRNVVNIEVQAAGKSYNAQNGRLSFVWLHPNYMPYDMYADMVKINNEQTEVIVRKKSMIAYNEVSFRYESDVTPMNAVMTECGTGVIEELSHDLTSEQYTATLNYDIQ